MITGTTKIVGIFSDPIEHTLSPIMHNAAFRYLCLDYVYVPFLVKKKDLKKAVESIRSLNIVGVNVTIPHKEEVIQYLDNIDNLAEKIGAVNTILRQNNLLFGYNTDGEGFLKSLSGKITLSGKKVLLVGAGGAGKAISMSLISKNISQLFIYDIILQKSSALVKKLLHYNKLIDIQVVKQAHIKNVLQEVDILINASPVGMHAGEPCVVEPKLLHNKLFVYDIVYNRRTELLKEAKRRSIPHISGIEMLIHQGALSFKLWTQREAPIEIMRKEVMKCLSGYLE